MMGVWDWGSFGAGIVAGWLLLAGGIWIPWRKLRATKYSICTNPDCQHSVSLHDDDGCLRLGCPCERPNGVTP